MLYGRYEPDTTAIVERLVKPNMICFDVGANMGFYTVLMARLAQSVVGFEPAISLYDRLRRHVELNRLRNVTTERLALSDRHGEGKIYVTPDSASIAPQHWSPDAATSVDTFDCMSLDEYCTSHGIHQIDFMKVDIDGHEPAFLRGAVTTLSRLRPTLIIEVVPECLAGGERTAVEICNMLISLGYQLSDGLASPCGSADELLERNPQGCNVLCRVRTD
jgi:FkbM family methyltransferase